MSYLDASKVVVAECACASVSNRTGRWIYQVNVHPSKPHSVSVDHTSRYTRWSGRWYDLLTHECAFDLLIRCRYDRNLVIGQVNRCVRLSSRNVNTRNRV